MERENFGSKLGVVLAAAGSAVGLGNIWRFPVETGQNGGAAFILITSLFVMQNGGIELNMPTIMLWILISVISAVGNAGVPMGCYFLTLSLMSGLNAPIGILGVILPVYTIIDMIETAVNVWSDSCICAIVDKKLLKDAD